MADLPEKSVEKRSAKAQKKGSMTVEEAGRLGGQKVKEMIEEGKRARSQELKKS